MPLCSLNLIVRIGFSVKSELMARISEKSGIPVENLEYVRVSDTSYLDSNKFLTQLPSFAAHEPVSQDENIQG